MEFELAELDDGEIVVSHEDGRYFNAGVINMMFELHRQNPEFYEHWVALAENYVLVGPAVAEA